MSFRMRVLVLRRLPNSKKCRCLTIKLLQYALAAAYLLVFCNLDSGVSTFFLSLNVKTCARSSLRNIEYISRNDALKQLMYLLQSTAPTRCHRPRERERGRPFWLASESTGKYHRLPYVRFLLPSRRSMVMQKLAGIGLALFRDQKNILFKCLRTSALYSRFRLVTFFEYSSAFFTLK